MSVTVSVETNDDEILCLLTNPAGEAREVYRNKTEKGNQTISLKLDSYERGEHVLSVYVNDELAVEKMILFE